MSTHEKGVPVYLTAAEVQALGDAGGYLSNLIEQCSVLPDDLSNASNGVHSIHCKALKAQGKAGRRDTVSRALRLADEILGRLEATTSKGASLWIARDDRSDGVELWRLDCAHGYRGRQFDELPRFYRTTRGAKQGAALLTRERLTWALSVPTNC